MEGEVNVKRSSNSKSWVLGSLAARSIATDAGDVRGVLLLLLLRLLSGEEKDEDDVG